MLFRSPGVRGHRDHGRGAGDRSVARSVRAPAAHRPGAGGEPAWAAELAHGDARARCSRAAVRPRGPGPGEVGRFIPVVGDGARWAGVADAAGVLRERAAGGRHDG